ncbi:insect antifreeze protein [Coprinopsis cinerea okayama7|uniref:Insect antifreeze protein n=1 Tax=Coprinopsis cinerea (strain Okayama-7 / 130 / ATCC MYA-4618 / FGSC 9003) TaxID=240176 RepID=A8P5U5_COPC7|nr:insect antifreeze protein [Coprinopsis cinerea okayama7\|eukprot:XP_001839024.2 insect antifreeze protein [Coprinopsis cinerea okayama7\
MRRLRGLLGLLWTLVLAQISYSQNNEPIVVCIPGTCIQGYSNITVGARISIPNSSQQLHLLPGTYTSTTSPQFLHNTLTTSGITSLGSQGFTNSTRLPLELFLDLGIAIFEFPRYTGESAFAGVIDDDSGPVESDFSIPLNASGLLTARDLVTTLFYTRNQNDTRRVTVWDAIPDFKQLPAAIASVSSSIALHNLESITCQTKRNPTPCSSKGYCTPEGSCLCAPGFAGDACEQCAAGHWGPECEPCPDNCTSCDEGIGGTGRCLTRFTEPGAPSTCNCENGVCGEDDECQCLPGWRSPNGGPQCSECAQGFFKTSNGDWELCGVGLYPDGDNCQVCDRACDTCFGPGVEGCGTCGRGRYMDPQGRCVETLSNGVCDGTSLVADNAKKVCDTCGKGCSACSFSNFDDATVFDDRRCTACLPGLVLHPNGQCVQDCPSNMFASIGNGGTPVCERCDSSCSSCSGTSTFCTSCPSPNLLNPTRGTCNPVPCPSSTFEQNGACIPCHPDCASCSGPSYDQCTSCSSTGTRPLLLDGICLPHCRNKNEWFDGDTGRCARCHESCGSCMGPREEQCLSCEGLKVLREGRCVDAPCAPPSSSADGDNAAHGLAPGVMVPDLGVCLSELVLVPSSGTSTGGAPLPSISGINTPTKGKSGLEWWQILLIVLGCVLVLVIILLIWWRRRRARSRKEASTKGDTYVFNGLGRNYDEEEGGKKGWRWNLISWSEWLFSGSSRRHRDNLELEERGRERTRRKWSIPIRRRASSGSGSTSKKPLITSISDSPPKKPLIAFASLDPPGGYAPSGPPPLKGKKPLILVPSTHTSSTNNNTNPANSLSGWTPYRMLSERHFKNNSTSSSTSATASNPNSTTNSPALRTLTLSPSPSSRALQHRRELSRGTTRTSTIRDSKDVDDLEEGVIGYRFTQSRASNELTRTVLCFNFGIRLCFTSKSILDAYNRQGLIGSYGEEPRKAPLPPGRGATPVGRGGTPISSGRGGSPTPPGLASTSPPTSSGSQLDPDQVPIYGEDVSTQTKNQETWKDLFKNPSRLSGIPASTLSSTSSSTAVGSTTTTTSSSTAAVPKTTRPPPSFKFRPAPFPVRPIRSKGNAVPELGQSAQTVVPATVSTSAATGGATTTTTTITAATTTSGDPFQSPDPFNQTLVDTPSTATRNAHPDVPSSPDSIMSDPGLSYYRGEYNRESAVDSIVIRPFVEDAAGVGTSHPLANDTSSYTYRHRRASADSISIYSQTTGYPPTARGSTFGHRYGYGCGGPAERLSYAGGRPSSYFGGRGWGEVVGAGAGPSGNPFVTPSHSASGSTPRPRGPARTTAMPTTTEDEELELDFDSRGDVGLGGSGGGGEVEPEDQDEVEAMEDEDERRERRLKSKFSMSTLGDGSLSRSGSVAKEKKDKGGKFFFSKR